MMTAETWRLVPSLPEYEASSLGRIRCVPYEGLMPNGGVRIYGGKPCVGSWDQRQARYTFMFRGKTYRVARCVCEAFHGPAPFPKADTMHLDEDSRNNRPGNLEWGTRKQNLNHQKIKAYHRLVCERKMTKQPLVLGRVNHVR